MAKRKTVVPFHGTAEQEKALRELIAAHKEQQGALMPVLQGAQEIYGYLPIEVQTIIAEELNIPLAEVYGVVTFYAQFTANSYTLTWDWRVHGHGLLCKGRRRCAGAHPEAAGHRARRHHPGRPLLTGGDPLHRRVRPGPGHDHQ